MGKEREGFATFPPFWQLLIFFFFTYFSLVLLTCLSCKPVFEYDAKRLDGDYRASAQSGLSKKKKKEQTYRKQHQEQQKKASKQMKKAKAFLFFFWWCTLACVTPPYKVAFMRAGTGRGGGNTGEKRGLKKKKQPQSSLFLVLC